MATLNVKNLPDGLYERVRSRARRDRRSIAQEVIHLLEQSLAEPEKRSILDLQGLGREAWQGEPGEEHVEKERGAWD